MLRLIVQIDDAGMACNVGGAVLTTFKTFDVDLPDVEAALKPGGKNALYHSQIIGSEIIEIAAEASA